MGFLSSEICPFKYSSSLIPAGSPPGELISILSEYILIFIEAGISHIRWTSALATASLKVLPEPAGYIPELVLNCRLFYSQDSGIRLQNQKYQLLFYYLQFQR